jgi:hypothetical protein
LNQVDSRTLTAIYNEIIAFEKFGVREAPEMLPTYLLSNYISKTTISLSLQPKENKYFNRICYLCNDAIYLFENDGPTKDHVFPLECIPFRDIRVMDSESDVLSAVLCALQYDDELISLIHFDYVENEGLHSSLSFHKNIYLKAIPPSTPSEFRNWMYIIKDTTWKYSEE